MTPLMTLGMWSKHPDADLVAAREAFARGELAASVAASDAACAATWVGAETVGQGRRSSIATIGDRAAVPAGAAGRDHEAAPPTATSGMPSGSGQDRDEVRDRGSAIRNEDAFAR